jgi:hypothetical protein
MAGQARGHGGAFQVRRAATPRTAAIVGSQSVATGGERAACVAELARIGATELAAVQNRAGESTPSLMPP